MPLLMAISFEHITPTLLSIVCVQAFNDRIIYWKVSLNRVFYYVLWLVEGALDHVFIFLPFVFSKHYFQAFVTNCVAAGNHVWLMPESGVLVVIVVAKLHEADLAYKYLFYLLGLHNRIFLFRLLVFFNFDIHHLSILLLRDVVRIMFTLRVHFYN